MANDGKFMSFNPATGLLEQELAIQTSAGAADANKIARTDATGKLDPSIIPAGGGSTDTRSMTASEALSAGDLVNTHGTNSVRKADADVAGREANGFVLSAIANGTTGIVNLEEGIITGLSGMTPGAAQFLGSVAGARVEVCPAAPAFAQVVGKALTATELLFRPAPAYKQV